MIEAICDYLIQKLGLYCIYLEEIAAFVWDEIQTTVTTSSIRRALVAKGWSRKTAR